MKKTQFQFEAIGTKWVVDVYKELSLEEESFLLEKIMNRINQFDMTYSRFKSESKIMKISGGGEVELPEDADKLFGLYKKVYDISIGLVTPLVGQTLSDMGYDATYSLEKKSQVYKPLAWEEVIEWNSPVLILKKPAILDFGAGGKGYLVDIVGELLESSGVHGYCVDAGGDIRQRSTTDRSLKVGLENPHNTEQVLGVLNLQNKSICASASNRRAWGEMHHIVNPETLKPTSEVIAVWVVADTTFLADILATALFFVPAEKLLKYFTFEYLVMYLNNTIIKSEGFKAELFT
ncbi:MAG: FAD:protein FMN transferase [Patescibacteria group bacterium]